MRNLNMKEIQIQRKKMTNNTKPIYSAWQTVDISHFEKQKLELDAHRPFPPQALKSLEEKLEVDEVHNSTAIEGNSLTLGETALVLQKGLTVSGKPLKDHLEIKGYDDGYQYIKSIYQSAHTLSEKVILEIHRLIFRHFENGLEKEYTHGIGRYRNMPVYISGSEFVPPNYIKVPELMAVLIDFLNGIKKDAVRRAILAHFGLVHIHPFMDGNGRTARLLMNLLLLADGYPIITVKNDRRANYIASLEALHQNPADTAFFKLMTDFLQESFDLYKSLYS